MSLQTTTKSRVTIYFLPLVCVCDERKNRDERDSEERNRDKKNIQKH